MIEETCKDTRREITIGEAIAHLAIHMSVLDAEHAGINHFGLNKMTKERSPTQGQQR